MQYSCGYVLRFLNSLPYFPHSHLCSGDTNTPADGGEGEKWLLDVGKSAKLSAHSFVNSCSFYRGLSKIENCCISWHRSSDSHAYAWTPKQELWRFNPRLVRADCDSFLFLFPTWLYSLRQEFFLTCAWIIIILKNISTLDTELGQNRYSVNVEWINVLK